MAEFVSPASEFPNDNPALHAGAIWVCATPCAAATAELREMVEAPASVEVQVEVPVEVEVAAPVEVASYAPADESDPMLADDGDEIEIVDDLDAIVADADADDGAERGDAIGSDGADDDEPFAVYVRTMTDVMIAAGGGDAAAHLASALADEPTARAWRRIISGESEDFAACGAKSLDEWSAELVARLIAMPAKTDQLRRELRARGVAAFGIVV